MKLFCVLIIIVFVVVLGSYYAVMGVQTYNKIMKKYKKKLLTSPGSCAIL